MPLYVFLYVTHQVRQVAMKAVLSQQAYLLFYTKLTPKQELKVYLLAWIIFVGMIIVNSMQKWVEN